jgi:hypothetical protein
MLPHGPSPTSLRCVGADEGLPPNNLMERRNMASLQNKGPARSELNKRYTPQQQQALNKAARAAVERLYCDVLEFWRACLRKRCRRIGRCTGEPGACLKRGWPDVPEGLHDWARAEVIAGGPRRTPPASHREWVIRSYAVSGLT